MTLEELSKLFPIKLVPYSKEWSKCFEAEKNHLLHILPRNKIVSIHHIESTAIQDISAKNIVDILIEVDNKDDLNYFNTLLVQKKYRLMSKNTTQILLNKGYTVDNFLEKVYHIHLRLKGDNNEVYFRDYVNKHPQIAKKYESLKLTLENKYKYDRDGYTAAKTEFIRKWTKIAKMH